MTDKHTGRYTDLPGSKEYARASAYSPGRQTDRQIDRQTDRQTGRQKERYTKILRY